jgi:plasmid stabilization system protein ParE
MGRFKLTPSAKRDIREIVRYLSQRSPQEALTVREKLKAAMGQLADFPDMGHFRPEITDESLRVWSVYSYLIVYRSGKVPLEVVRVIHGARDLGSFDL